MLRFIIKNWIVLKKRIKSAVFLTCCILSSGLFFLLISEGASYLIFRDKINDYTTDVLRRAEFLIEQTQSVSIAAKANADASDWPCSYENLQRLRMVIWPNFLVKDAGYVSRSGLTCSAIWGNLRTPMSISHYKKEIQLHDSLWLLDVSLLDEVSAAIYIKNGIAVFVSPFAFSRFETEAPTKDYSAVVGDGNHNKHYFKIGPDAGLVDKHERPPLDFTFARKCSLHYDLCVVGGAFFKGIVAEHWSIVLLLLLMSAISGTMIFIIIMSRKELNDSLSTRFLRALRTNGLSLVYQPIYKIEDESIIGFETLLRWNDERLGAIGPDVFIPLSEKAGLQEDVSIYVLTHSIQEFIHVAITHNLFLSININVSDLNSERFSSTLISLVKKYNIPEGILLLEITERQSGNVEDMRGYINKYKRFGVRFAIDDFGTAYSNLNLVAALDVDEIKIDKCLTDSIGTSSVNYEILPGLREMFRNISEKVVFEGMETQTQINYLKEFWSKSSAQGWYYSKAVHLEDAIILIDQNKENKC